MIKEPDYKPREDAETRAGLDAMAREILSFLATRWPQFGKDRFDAAAYHAFARRADDALLVPMTALTTACARLLFGLSALQKPRRTEVLGCYYGNSLAWLAGGHDDPHSSYTGCDIDAAAIVGARENMARLAPKAQVETVEIDAFERLAGLKTPIDLLFIDIDHPHHRKQEYRALLELALPKLAPGALVIAHDRCEPTFASDFDSYLELVRNPTLFAETITLPIDPAGLEVSLRC